MQGMNSLSPGFLARAAQQGASSHQSSPAKHATLDTVITATHTHKETSIEDLLAESSAEAAHLETKLAQHVPGEVLVRLREKSAQIQDFASSYGAEVKESIPLPQSQRMAYRELLRLQLPADVSTAQAITAMSHDPRVAYAVTNDILRTYREMKNSQSTDLANVPADLDPKLWGLNNLNNPDCDIDAGKAWNISTGRRDGEVIAVIDTGVDTNHRALRNNIWTDPKDGSHGFNALNDSNNPADDHGHGTHCSGTIGANGTDGFYGVNHKASIMPVKFLAANGEGKLSDAIKGISWADSHGARVMSNSWGGGEYNEALRDTISGSSALQVFAAGNDSSNNDTTPAYPASYHTSNMLVVAATNRDDMLAGFSNYGANSVDLAAPGDDIWSTVPNNQYKSMRGTSMATPHVAGAAVLIANQFPGISNDQIKARILLNVDQVANLQGKVASGGRLNLAAALKQDNVAPGAVGDLKVLAVKSGKVDLSWLAAGDDGDQGRAGVYQVRYSDRPIVEGPAGEGEISFDKAVDATSGRPAEPGTLQDASIQIPTTGDDQTVYVAVRVLDHVGNPSKISSVKTIVPASKVVYTDDKNTANWSHDGRWGQVTVGSRTRVWTDSPNGNYENGVNSALTSKSISLRNSKGNRAIFDAKFDIENKYDNLYVEASKDGKSWSKLATFTGSSDWSARSVDLSAYDGEMFRFASA